MKDIHKSHNLTTRQQTLHDKNEHFSDRRLALTPPYYHSMSYIHSGNNRWLFMLLWLEPCYFKKLTWIQSILPNPFNANLKWHCGKKNQVTKQHFPSQRRRPGFSDLKAKFHLMYQINYNRSKFPFSPYLLLSSCVLQFRVFRTHLFPWETFTQSFLLILR